MDRDEGGPLPFLRQNGDRRADKSAGAATPGMGRRDALRGLLAGVGAAAVIPGLAPAHPIRQHLEHPERVAAADARAGAADWTREFLDEHQFETLESLAELILPGSRALRVSQFVDQLLAVDSRDNQRRFLNTLGIFEGEARRRAGRPWKDLTAADQAAILTEASTMASGRVEPAFWTRGADMSVLLAPAVPHSPTLRDHFDHLRDWISGAYFSTEAGMRELGWDGTLFFDSYPGCDHPGGHG